MVCWRSVVSIQQEPPYRRCVSLYVVAHPVVNEKKHGGDDEISKTLRHQSRHEMVKRGLHVA
jgi:hypothetical protein